MESWLSINKNSFECSPHHFMEIIFECSPHHFMEIIHHIILWSSINKNSFQGTPYHFFVILLTMHSIMKGRISILYHLINRETIW